LLWKTFFFSPWRWCLINYLPRLDLTHNPPISACQVARITGMSQQNLATVILIS
jgi:hypothetical protein